MPDLAIISGAQTGVDTAAIKTAIALKIPYRGWVPNGFTNEVGVVAEQYHANLSETPSRETAQRTEWNIRDADMILTILRGPPDKAVGGTKLGVNFATKGGKSMCFVNMTGKWDDEVAKVREWLQSMGDVKRSVAIGGPRESEEPGIEEEATRFLMDGLSSRGCPTHIQQ